MKDKPTSKTSLSTSSVIPFLIVFTLSVLASRQLFHSWMSNRTEMKSVIFFIVWVLPVIWYQLTLFRAQRPHAINHYALYASIIITLIGVIGSLNTLCYIGFAVAILALLPPKPPLLLWLLTSVVWMPAFGWVALWYFAEYAFILRLAIVTIASILTIYALREVKNKGLEHE